MRPVLIDVPETMFHSNETIHTDENALYKILKRQLTL